MSVCHGDCCARVVRQERVEGGSMKRGGEVRGRSFERRRAASYGWSEPSSSGRRESSDHPKGVELNWKSSLVGAQIPDADEELFMRRQSSLSSMFRERIKQRSSELETDCRISASSRSNVGSRNHSGSLSSIRPVAKESTSGSLSLGRGIAKESSSSGSLSSSRCIVKESSRSSSIRSDHGGHTMLPVNASSRLPSGDLYPCYNPRGSNPNSCSLDVAHFTFGNNNKEPQDPESNGNLIERIYKKLMGQSRLHRSSSRGAGAADESSQPVGDCPASPVAAEQRFFRRGNSSKRKSLRSIVEDANTVVAANPRPKSQLAQYLRSITAASAQLVADDDDDDLEGPSEVAWLEPDSPSPCSHSARADRSYASTPGSNPKRRFSLESWSSTSCSWNLQNPVSTIVGRKQQQQLNPTSRFGNDIKRVSLTGSYNGTYFGKAKVKKSSEFSSSTRSWWSEIGSGRRSSASLWTCSGRSQMEADSAQPDTAPANNTATVPIRQVEGKAKVADFSIPVASSFTFHDGSVPSLVLQNSAATMISDSDSDIYHDPVEMEVSGELVPWDSALQKHSFDFVKEIAMRTGSGMSTRSLSRLLFIERVGTYESNGRFSIDLQRGQKIDKALPSTRSSLDVRLRHFSSEKSKRSILAPCLPFLQSNHSNNKHELDQQRVSMNSFTSRLGRVVSEAPSIASPIYVT